MRLTKRSSIMCSSGALILLGLTVMLGWHFGLTRVVQLHPAFPPMQYNTALCFLLAGFATLFMRNRPRIAGALAIAVAAVGAVSLLQYVVGGDFGIDELLMKAYVTVESSHAGRMAPQTAVGFTLAAVAVLVLTLLDSLPRYRLAVELIASLLCGFAIAALIGYCVGVEPAYGWGELTRVAAHTACGFVVLGVALLQNAWRAQPGHRDRGSPQLAIPVGTAALATVLSVSHALSQWQSQRVDEAAVHALERASTVLELRLRDYVETFGSLADTWGRAGGGPQRAWENDVALFLRDAKVFMAVSHIRADGRLDWIFPAERFADHIGFDYSASAQRAAGLAAARERGRPVMTPALALKSGKQGILIISPLLSRGSEPDSFVVTAALLEDLFFPTGLSMPGYRLAVMQNDTLLYETGPAEAARRSHSREIRFDGVTLRLEATPLPDTVADLRSGLPTLVLVIGVLASLLLALTAHVAQVSSRRAAELATINRLLAAKRKQLERLALFDELTGIGNRNLLMAEFDKRLKAARRSSEPLAVLLLDLNGFKAINDDFGHDAGDRVLNEFAARLTEALPLSAEAFRTGGDEFAVLTMPGTSIEQALVLAAQIERATNIPLSVGNEERVIHASIGIAAYPRHGEECARLLRAADVAMYQAKRSAGGTQVASDDSPTGVLRALRPTR